MIAIVGFGARGNLHFSLVYQKLSYSAKNWKLNPYLYRARKPQFGVARRTANRSKVAAWVKADVGKHNIFLSSPHVFRQVGFSFVRFSIFFGHGSPMGFRSSRFLGTGTADSYFCHTTVTRIFGSFLLFDQLYFWYSAAFYFIETDWILNFLGIPIFGDRQILFSFEPFTR